MPTHAEQKIVPYTAEQLFELVADVGKYPEFLPWCLKAVVTSRTEHELIAELVVGFGPFREAYTSRVELDRPHRIVVRCIRGPFQRLENIWTFHPVPEGCAIDFYVDFEFRSRLLRNAIGMVFNEGVRLMVKAFMARACDIYGPPVTRLS
ncbi:type II toxin-antitoxin system RatA family toxin [Oecophyllibacter saccharovorans]|uniref:Type II toxin-antitoxin system RatA family toxin n=1 Tax=Oecophyllibacter saccharovorans TaxID=2558360 RepID=A0A506UQG4_9PROT|nr:type II toxin-antitoxin system RatA family toxin [Oecophyllibacter saccharovorans]TPW35570.1 type II toxin-antitoxin system RatA family toxin [Oecophyllibacter saccharovorans]